MTNADDHAPDPILSTEKATAPAARSGIRTWALALVLGLAAGMTAWGIGEAVIVPETGFHSEKQKIDVPPSVAGIRNGLLSFTALGAVIGLGMGLAGGLIRRSVPRAIMAGAIGLLLAGGVGGALSWLILPFYYAQPGRTDMIYSLMVHGGIWVSVGAVAGLAFGIGLGGRAAWVRGLIGGAGAALLATVIYEFAGGILFPTALTDRPVSQTWQSRLVARLLVTVLIAAGVVLAADLTAGRKDVDKATT